MKVVVDLKLCEGNMKCQEAAPEVFEVRDDDKSHLLIENPPERMRDKLKLAARLCPRQAITVKRRLDDSSRATGQNANRDGNPGIAETLENGN